jgi:predicted small secreted protein
MKRLAVLMLAVCAVALAGCHTVQGIGKDVEKAGEAIQKSTR